MNQTLLTIFVAVTAIAVVLQMAILAALYFTMKKTATQVQSLATRVEEQAMPAIETARTFMTENSPKLNAIVENTRALLTENTPKVNAIVSDAADISAAVRGRAERIGVTVDDIVDRTRLQAIRADEMVTRTFDRVEQGAETMHHVVTSPMRRMSAVMTGVMTGLGEFVGGRRVRRTEKAVPKDDMFI